MSNIDQETFERVISQVRRPSSYLGSEFNTIRKDPDKISGSMALVFPDQYDIGMSHLGLKILYNIINSHPDLAAERAFAPEEDFAEVLRREDIPMFSLETKKPLRDFDVIGFTIPYELSYTNMLWILDLARVPIKARDRGADDPLVIGGGAGVYNPEPIAEFFDLFVLGDGEIAAVEVLRAAVSNRDVPRGELLRKLAEIPGVYVPSLFDVSYDDDGRISEVAPKLTGYKKAKRCFLPTLAESPYPVNLVVPFGSPVQDRLNVEIDRGCTQGCRFCQAGTTYRPVRERAPDEVLRIMDETIKRTGYDGVSVTSLSAGDYSKIGGLLKLLMDKYSGESVSLSLPSLRASTVTNEIIHEVMRVKRTGFTVAAEAGSQRLRDTLNKKVTDEQILSVASRLLESGWRSVKLYFMIGLPTETDEDIDAIYSLASRLAALGNGQNRLQNISVSVSNFVPKAHTAFQWSGQDTVEELVAKKERLFSLIKRNRRLRLKWHEPRMSHLEAVFSRGDRRLAKVVESAYRLGRRLDAWTERFDFDQWMEAFAENGVDPAFYANRDIGHDEILPWDHIDTGLSKKYFLKEWKSAQSGEVTVDCRANDCIGCGLDPRTCFKPYEWSSPGIAPEAKAPPEGRFKYRLTYHKKSLSRFLSHLEMKSIFIRALRMAQAPLRYSEGFSPHPRISFGSALPVGVESEEEFLDIELADNWACEELKSSLNGRLPDGVKITGCGEIPIGAPSITSVVTGFLYTITLDDSITPESVSAAVERFNSSETVVVERQTGKRRQTDIRPLVDSISSEGRTVSFTTGVSQNGAARPDDVMRALFPDIDIPPKKIIKLSNRIIPDRS